MDKNYKTGLAYARFLVRSPVLTHSLFLPPFHSFEWLCFSIIGIHITKMLWKVRNTRDPSIIHMKSCWVFCVCKHTRAPLVGCCCALCSVAIDVDVDVDVVLLCTTHTHAHSATETALCNVEQCLSASGTVTRIWPSSTNTNEIQMHEARKARKAHEAHTSYVQWRNAPNIQTSKTVVLKQR